MRPEKQSDGKAGKGKRRTLGARHLVVLLAVLVAVALIMRFARTTALPSSRGRPPVKVRVRGELPSASGDTAGGPAHVDSTGLVRGIDTVGDTVEPAGGRQTRGSGDADKMVAPKAHERHSLRSAGAKAKTTQHMPATVPPRIDTYWGVNERPSSLGQSDTATLNRLVTALENDDKMVRRKTVLSLAQLGGNDAVQPLIAALGDPDTIVVVWAIKALGSLADTCAVEPLLDVLHVESFQPDAAEALARIGDRRAIEPLRAVAETCDSCAAVHEALRALQKAGG